MRYFILLIVVCFVNCQIVLSYDVILTGIEEYNTPVSYSNKSILITSSSYIIYDSNLILENCTMDVNGSVECKSDITLIHSVINVKGDFKVQPGTTIKETGPSSIIAAGDSVQAGRISIEGKLDNPITIISDNVSTDSELIIIDANSSSNSSLKCIDFYGGWVNIQIYNKRLNNAISNCRFFGSEYAIWQDGIQELTTVSFSLFCQNYISIYGSVDGTSRTITYPLIDNVVIDGIPGETWGIILAGGQSISYFDYFAIINSIITNCYCGWYFDADSVYPPNMLNLAYYGNDYDDNHGHPDFVRNPMYLTQSPFEEPENPGDWPYFINPASPVADVNLGYNIWQDASEQMLTSVYSDSTPRTNKGIGVGVPVSSEYFSNAYNIEGDFDKTGRVNFLDYSIFALEWGSIKDVINYSIADFDRDKDVDIFDLEVLINNWLSSADDGDFNDDNNIDFADYSIFAGEWQAIESNSIHFPDANGYSIADFDYSGTVDTCDLERFTNNWLAESGINLTVDDNESSLVITCQHLQGLEVTDYALFLDGQYIASRDPNNNPVLVIDKMKYSKGTHYLKAVVRTADGNLYMTMGQDILFNSPLHDLSFNESFDPDKKFTISGRVDAGYIATLSVKNLDNQVLWSDSYTSDFITKLDSSVFSSEIEFEVTYSYEEDVSEMLESGSSMMTSSSSPSSGSSSVAGLEGTPDNRAAGLILCMIEDGMKDGADWTDTGTCMFAYKMMDSKGIKPLVLRGYGSNNMVRHGMINRVFRKYPNIRYGHIYAHGNYLTDGAGIFGFDVRRTRILFNDGEWVAFNSRKWLDKGQAVPAGYEYLSDTYEHAHYLNQIPFAPGQLKILVIESCYALQNIVTIDSAGLCHYVNGQYNWEVNNHRNYSYDYDYPYSDICAGLNMTGNQFYLGGGEAIIKGPYPYYSRLFNHFWDGLGSGDTTWDAWYNAKFYSGITVEVSYKHRWRGAGIDVTLSGN